MRVLFRARPKSFLDASRREWQFDAFAWMLRNCGGYADFLASTLVLPTEKHFPDRGMSGHAAVAALFRRVREHAGMAEWPCTVEPESLEPQAGSQSSSGIPLITYKPGTHDPVLLVAAFARELAQYLVETFEEGAPGGESSRGPAVDLATVFMGFGLFMANSTLQSARHDLCEGELVHALAVFCLLRKTEPAVIEGHLNPHLRKYLRLAARDLAQHEPRFQQLRAVAALGPVEFADHTLPTRLR